MTSEILILKPFNAVYFGLFAVFLLLFLLANVIARRRDERFRRRFLACIMGGALVVFFLYKLFLSMDADFTRISAEAGLGGFNWWGELPLQLCNINMILVPVAVLTKKRPLMSFCFFLGPLGALMALTMPCAGFDCYSILLPRMLGYYITHWMVFFGGISVCSFGLYKPEFRDILPTALTALVLAFVIFLVDMLMRSTGLHPYANYFYAVETEGNFILDLFYGFLPYPFLYLLPCILILLPYTLIVTALIRFFSKRGKKPAAAGV